jgi:metal-responsive CopG/Arc/MetJ family transcriptional regulator
MRRGAVRKDQSRLMTVWIPVGLLPFLDAAVKAEDTDRSKFVRRAIREKLMELGIDSESQ